MQKRRIHSVTPTAIRHEIDALIRGIGEVLQKKPEKVIKVLELWVNNPKAQKHSSSKKKAA